MQTPLINNLQVLNEPKRGHYLNERWLVRRECDPLVRMNELSYCWFLTHYSKTEQQISITKIFKEWTIAPPLNMNDNIKLIYRFAKGKMNIL